MTFVDQRVNHLRHVILGCFECQKTGRLKGMPENPAAGNQRPKQGNHPAHDAAHSLDAYHVAGRRVGLAQVIQVWLSEASLWHQNKC